MIDDILSKIIIYEFLEVNGLYFLCLYLFKNFIIRKKELQNVLFLFLWWNNDIWAIINGVIVDFIFLIDVF